MLRTPVHLPTQCQTNSYSGVFCPLLSRPLIPGQPNGSALLGVSLNRIRHSCFDMTRTPMNCHPPVLPLCVSLHIRRPLRKTTLQRVGISRLKRLDDFQNWLAAERAEASDMLRATFADDLMPTLQDYGVDRNLEANLAEVRQII